jgi:sterol 14-demethylase
MSQPTPPILAGLPVLGNALDFSRDANALFWRGYRELGSIFAIRLANKPAAVLIGPQNLQFFFEQTDRILSMEEVYQFLKPMFGEKIFFASGPEIYQQQRAIMLPAFSARRMPGYLQSMQREVQEWLDSLGEQGEFDLSPTMEALTMHVAASAFMGKDFRRKMGAEFAALYRELAQGIEFLLPTNLPLPRFRRRDRAKAKLEAMVGKLIAERRADPQPHDDFLQAFLESTYPDGTPPTEDVLVTLVLGMVFAGHETTAGHASWGLVQLLQHPDYLNMVVEEVQACLPLPPNGDFELDLETIRRMERLEWALKETERMRPVATMLMRYNRQGYELGGYDIPQGWLSLAAIAVSHRLEEVFTDPQCYDPQRFAPGREEHRVHPYSLAGFGGARHKCLGMNFAYNEMKVIFSLLLKRYQLELLTPDPQPDPKISTNRPARGTMVRYRKK